MKSGASDPFADAKDDTGDDSATEAEDTEDTADAADAAEETERRDENGQNQVGADQAAVEQSLAEGGEVSESSTGGTTTDQPTTGDADAALDELADVGSESSNDGTESTDDGLTRDELPFVLRRDRVKEERPEVHQLFVQRETHDAAVDAERDLQDRLEDDLSRTDAREAIYLAGMDQLDAAEELLREWGYDL